MSQWQKKIKSSFRGVYYREHPTRICKRQKDKYFIIRYYKGDGKRTDEGLGWLSEGMTGQEANEIRTRIVSNIRLGKAPQSVAEMREMEEQRREQERQAEEAAVLENITFGEAAKEYLKWAENNKKSYIQDQSRYNHHLKKRFADLPMRSITRFPHLESLKRDLQKKGRADATIFQVLQQVRAIYHKAVEWGLYSGPVPTDGAKKLFPRINNQRTGFLAPDQALDLLARVKDKSFVLWCQCVLALHAGLRFGEIAALEWPDVNFDADTITIRNPKAGRDRAVYMNQAISDMFQELITVWTKKEWKFAGLVFPDTKGRKQKHVSRSFFEVVKDMGLNEGITDPKQRISFHSLRHTYGSQLAMQGFPIQLIQELMGHHSLEMTARYSHFSPGLRQEAAKSLANLFKEKPKEPAEQGENEAGGDVVSISGGRKVAGKGRKPGRKKKIS